MSRTYILSCLMLAALAGLTATPALAACVSRPDNAASHYVDNNTSLALCLQNEVAGTAARLQAEGRLNALRAEIAAEARRQRLLATPVPQAALPQAVW